MKNILFIAQFKDACGYANAARGFLRVLDKFLDKNEYNLKIFSLNAEKQDFSEGLDKELIEKYLLTPESLKSFINNNKYYLFLCGLPHFYSINQEHAPLLECFKNQNCIKKINSLFWETDKVPDMWLEIFKKDIFNQIIVSCEWNQKVFADQTSIKTDIIYPYVYDYYDLKQKNKKNKFRIFSMSQWQHRKGFDILLKAYYQEFFDQDDVELLIKTYRGETAKGSSEEKEKQIIAQEIIANKNSCLHYGKLPSSKVLLKTGFCSKEEIKKFYEEADVFCASSRGEGFGLTIAQAILSGVPVVVPNLGGHLDFVDRDNSFLIESRFESAHNMPFENYSSKDMNFIEPSILSTRQQLRKAYNLWKTDNKKLLEIGSNAKKYALNILDERKIYNKFMDLLK